jgi:hypothetical protein
MRHVVTDSPGYGRMERDIAGFVAWKDSHRQLGDGLHLCCIDSE